MEDKQLKLISNTAMAVGWIIFAVSACFIDSDGAYGYAAGVACTIGLIVAGTGYVIWMFSERLEEQRVRDFYNMRGKDRLDADVEFIEFETEK